MTNFGRVWHENNDFAIRDAQAGAASAVPTRLLIYTDEHGDQKRTRGELSDEHGSALSPVPDPRGVLTADTSDEATSLVRAAICPHSLRVNETPRKSVVFLSSLDLGACGLTKLKM